MSGDIEASPKRAPRRDQRGFLGFVANRTAVIFGLSALAVAQPLLELFGKNPEFFVAGSYSTGQIVLFAVLITVLPPVVGAMAVAASSAIDRRAGDAVFGAVVAALGVALVLAIVRSLGLDSFVLAIGLAVIGAVALGALVLRTRGGRLMASYLAVANLAFVAIFLFTSPASKLVSGAGTGDVGQISVPDLAGPVVMVVLDEFPAATIMRADGTINDDRYPGFAELASISSWFRNASSPHQLTHRAVPSLLDGNLSVDDGLPIYADHPRNIFTLLGQDVAVLRYESVTDLCPEAICEPAPQQSMWRALEDATIVYGHRVLPVPLRDDLPPIDNSWGAYGAVQLEGVAAPSAGSAGSAGEGSGSDEPTYIEQAYTRWNDLAADERSPSGQARIMQEHIDAITAEPALHFVHVALPHRPWVLSRTGVTTTFLPELVLDPADPSYDFENRMEFQLHSMQVGAADALVGELLTKLRSLPNWEETLLVVTSDHGSNLTPPDLGRMRVTEANREEVYRVPLFIKAPGQTDAEVRDDSAQSIDVLPSIVDLLDAEVDWTFDGHSLYDGSEARTPPKVSTDVDAVLEIARRRAEEFPHADDWVGLAAVGVNGDLVGRDAAEFSAGEPSELTVTFADGDLFDSLPTETGQMPFALHGTINGPAEPPELLVSINGQLAGVLGGYRPDGVGTWAFLGYVADLYAIGRNDVTVYEVERTADVVTLREVAGS